MPTYTVKSGDSWWRIAKKKLGDGSRWKELAAANPEINTLNPGNSVTIPGGGGTAVTQARSASRNIATETPGGRQLGGRIRQKEREDVSEIPGTIATETPGGRQLGEVRRPQPPQDVGAGDTQVSRPDRPNPDLMRQAEGARFDVAAGLMPSDLDNSFTDFSGDITPTDMARNIEPEMPDVNMTFQEGPPQNPVQALRSEYLSNPYFDMTQLASEFLATGEETNLLDPTLKGLSRGESLNQQVARDMRIDAARWADLYGDIDIEDEGDLWIQEQLGMVEPSTGVGGDEDIFSVPLTSGGIGFGGGLNIQRSVASRAPQRRNNYSSILGLVNWRI